MSKNFKLDEMQARAVWEANEAFDVKQYAHQAFRAVTDDLSRLTPKDRAKKDNVLYTFEEAYVEARKDFAEAIDNTPNFRKLAMSVVASQAELQGE